MSEEKMNFFECFKHGTDCLTCGVFARDHLRKFVEDNAALRAENINLQEREEVREIDMAHQEKKIASQSQQIGELVGVLDRVKKLTMGPSFELQDEIMCEVLRVLRSVEQGEK